VKTEIAYNWTLYDRKGGSKRMIDSHADALTNIYFCVKTSQPA